MTWVYLSPHFDDVALSSGGWVWEQVRSGEQVSIWTICGGEPANGALSPFARQLHARWEASAHAAAQRKAEDITACRRLGAGSLHLGLFDCIYRRDPRTGEFMYDSEESLNGALHLGDEQTLQELHAALRDQLPGEATLVCPLALGSHVDHQLTRLAAEGLGRECWYYADYPYVLHHRDQLEELFAAGWISQVQPISSAGLAAWQDSIGAYASQISTFWSGEAEMRQSIRDYCTENGGIRLWRRLVP